MVLEADSSIELCWSRHKETRIVMRMGLDPVVDSGVSGIGAMIQCSRKEGERFKVACRDFLRRGAWGTVNLTGLHDGSIVELG